MLTLLLSAQDGGTAWRNLLAIGEARAGLEPVGPLGLARRLGRILGIPAELATAPERLAAFALRLDAHDDGTRSYSASRAQDPFGVARYLLGLRDALRLLGWDGRPLDGSARLADLADLERLAPPLPPGLPDLLAELTADAAAGALPVPMRVELHAPRSAFPPLLRRLLDALAASGAAVVEAPADVALAPADTDLGRVQRALLAPGVAPSLGGDGSFVLLEADTPLEAAELTASLARSRSLDDAAFVVAAEPTPLDVALARQGLPTLGVPSASHLRPHLQVLPLRLALAFAPQDPFGAAELLLLPGGPLPGHARRALLAALGQMPGVGSPAWLEAVEHAVAAEVRRGAADGKDDAAASAAGAALRERIAAWFGGALHDPVAGIPAAAAAILCADVARWATARAQAAATGRDAADAAPETSRDAALWTQAAGVARTLEQLLVARPPGERLTQQALMQLHAVAVGSGPELAAFEAESGRPAVAPAPAAVTAPCAEVVWWGFVQGAEPGPAPEPWTGDERAALERAGVALPGAGEARALEAEGWRRPLLAARERVTLVRWRLAGTEAAGRHPFLDELASRLADGALAACTLTSEQVLVGAPGAPWRADAVALPPAGIMAQRPAWRLPAVTLAPSGTLSSTSLDALLGCPFRWALRYQAQLRRGDGVSLPDGARLLGDFAHRVLQDLLCGPQHLELARATPDDARAWARRAFDARVGVEAAPLVRRGAEVERDRARTLVAAAAASLFELLRRTGWRPVDAEREVRGTFADQPAAGYVDLVVEKDGVEAVVDLKLSGLRYRREELEQGHGLQLALYASLLGRRGAPPPTGFFVLDAGQLLTTDAAAFPGATLVDGPGTEATLRGAEAGVRYWRKVLAAGVLPSMREGLDWEAAVTAAAGPPPDEDGLARRTPPCRFCDFDALCVPAAPRDDEVAP